MDTIFLHAREKTSPRVFIIGIRSHHIRLECQMGMSVCFLSVYLSPTLFSHPFLQVVLHSVERILEIALQMDAGKFAQPSSDIILFAIRYAPRNAKSMYCLVNGLFSQHTA